MINATKALLVLLALVMVLAVYLAVVAYHQGEKIRTYEKALLVGKTEAEATLAHTAELLQEAKEERALRVVLQARFDTLEAARNTIRNEKPPRPATVPALHDSILRAIGR